MKKIFVLMLILALSVVFGCRGLFDDDEEEEAHKKDETVSISKEYWGTWIRMDTGGEYYIDSSSIIQRLVTSSNNYRKTSSRYYPDANALAESYSNSSSGNNSYNNNDYSNNNYNNYSIVESTIATNVNGYVLDGDNVMKNGSIVYFRKGGSARDFTMTVTGFSDSRTIRAINTGKQGISGKRENKGNSGDNETVTSDTNGNLNFTGAVADDIQKITIGSTTSAEVIPQYNGENLGSIPVLEEDSYGFKTTYSIDSDEQGYCFGNDYKEYSLSIQMTNVGSVPCETSYYEVTCNDSNLKFISGKKTGNIYTLNAGDSNTFSFTVKYGTITEEYKDVPINISITDSSEYEKTWNDTVILRFYKGLVPLRVKAHNITDSYNSYGSLNGFVIYPDGRSKRFTVNSDSTETIQIPYSTSDYILAFSGADNKSEKAYSFGFPEKTDLADLSGDWLPSEIKAYEPNDSTTTAANLTDLTKPVRAYLKANDIDFYTVNCSSLSGIYAPVSYVTHEIKEYDDSYSNNDNLASPGETLYLDLKLQNTIMSDISNVEVNISSNSTYVSFQNDSHNFYSTPIKAGCYYSLSDNSGAENAEDCSLDPSSYNVFKFAVSSDCPVGTNIPFILTFKDSENNKWTDKFSITVHGSQAKIELADSTDGTNYAVKEYENGNDDGLVTAGESLYLDVKAYNSGNSKALGVTATISTINNYVTIERDHYTIGDMKVGYYKSLTDTDDYNDSSDNCNLMDSWYDSKAFKFLVSSDCPNNTEIPFTVTFTDSSGNTWTDTFTITAYTTKAVIALASDTNYAVREYENGNDDGLVTAGESLYLDIKAYNSGSSTALEVTATLSTTSNYVTIVRDSYTIGDMKAEGYYTLTAYSSSSSVDLMDSWYYSKAFQFSVSSDCPNNTELPFTVTFTDSSGNTWTGSFSITAYKADIALVSDTNYAVKEYANGNDDGLVTPGESLYLDVKAYNAGSSKALGVTATLSTTSNYVTIERDSYTIGDMKAGYYKSLTDTYDNNSNFSQCKLMYSSYYSERAFMFSVDSSCPSGTELPFTVTFTDSSGNVWTDTLTIPVQ